MSYQSNHLCCGACDNKLVPNSGEFCKFCKIKSQQRFILRSDSPVTQLLQVAGALPHSPPAPKLPPLPPLATYKIEDPKHPITLILNKKGVPTNHRITLHSPHSSNHCEKGKHLFQWTQHKSYDFYSIYQCTHCKKLIFDI
jgi:hypothetical protein